MANKVKICGVDTSNLPKLSNKEMEELMQKLKAGNKEAKKQFILVMYFTVYPWNFAYFIVRILQFILHCYLILNDTLATAVTFFIIDEVSFIPPSETSVESTGVI